MTVPLFMVFPPFMILTSQLESSQISNNGSGGRNLKAFLSKTPSGKLVCLGMGKRVSSSNRQCGVASEHPGEPRKKTESRINRPGVNHATPPVNVAFTG
jgi:hypothetical protein